MSDLHDLLDRRARNIRPARMPDAFDRAMRRAERRHRNRRFGAALLALAVFAGAGTGLWIAFQPATGRHAPPAAEVPIPGTASTISLSSAPSGVAIASDGTIWATLPDSLAKIDPATGRVEEQYASTFSAQPGDLTGIAIERHGRQEFAWLTDSGGFVWAVVIGQPTNMDISLFLPDRIAIGGPAMRVAVGAGSVWVTVAHDGPGELVRIDPFTENITGRFTTGDGPGAVAVGEGGVWVQVTSGNARLQRFDPSTGELVGEEEGGGSVAATADEAWASGSDTVRRVMPGGTAVTLPIISPEPSGGLPSPSPAPSALVPGAGALTISGDQVWTAANPNPDKNGLLYEIDRRTADLIGAPTPVGMTPTAVAVADGSVWVANYNDPSLSRVELMCGGSPCAGPSPTPIPTTGSAPTPSVEPTPSEAPTSSAAPGVSLDNPPVPFFVGNHLVGGGFDARSAVTPDGREVGLLSPVASFLPDGRMLYLEWPDDIVGTEIHVFDSRTGEDHVKLVNGSSFAVRGDGAIAYSIGDADVHTLPLLPSPTASPARMGGIDVTPDARFDSSVAWLVGRGAYVAAGWAGNTLLAYHQDGPGWDVLAIDSPNQVRTLAETAQIVAISPDGTEALLDDLPASPDVPPTASAIEVVRVADGSVMASEPPSSLSDPQRSSPIGPLGAGGDWVGNTVVAPSGDGTVFLHVDGSSISVDQEVVIDGYPSLTEPEFISGDAHRVIGWVRVRVDAELSLSSWIEIDIADNGTPSVQLGPSGDLPGVELGVSGSLRPVRSLSRPVAHHDSAS